MPLRGQDAAHRASDRRGRPLLPVPPAPLRQEPPAGHDRRALPGGSEEPTITAAAIYAHNDLDSGGPEYLLDPDVDTADVEECGVSGDFVGVYALNDKCGGGHRDRLDAFRDWVVAHERRHETSLNECIKAVNKDDRLGEVESIVSTKSEADAKDQAEKLWTDGLRETLLDARETAQKGASTDFYHCLHRAVRPHGAGARRQPPGQGPSRPWNKP